MVMHMSMLMDHEMGMLHGMMGMMHHIMALRHEMLGGENTPYMMLIRRQMTAMMREMMAMTMAMEK